MSDPEEFNVSAPWSWNARHFVDRGCPRTGGSEFLLYSDSGATGGLEAACPPYVLTNCIGQPENGRLAPVIAVYLDDHSPDFDVQPMDKTDTEGWLNLSLDDEIACLISVVAGVRLRSGGAVRRFTAEPTDRGTPGFYAHRVPDWTAATRPIYPTPRTFPLEPLADWMNRYLALGREDAVALVRAARQFRDALWVADTDPELAWLLLVSAVEVIAGREALRDVAPAERLRQEMPALTEQLLAAGGDAHLEAVAEQLVSIVKATARFMSCMDKYRPDAPEIRPEEYAQVDWEWPRLKKAINLIYRFRSERLHGGVPFPQPMCYPPMTSGAALDERPSGLAAAAGNASWMARDLPMHLHTFGYIVRGCLLNWWRSLPAAAVDAPSPDASG
ncbi:hypothetical protein [Streptomyces sp. NPDC091294]|uniref:hypothetical protein n=1 Tax=Streptomyces sp. NPDC091294 TaxID=3365992 RepID=UPI00381DCBAD